MLYSDKGSIAALYVPTALGHAVPWHTRCSSPVALEPQQNSSCQGPRYFGEVVCLAAGILLIRLHGLHGLVCLAAGILLIRLLSPGGLLSQNLGLNQLP